MQYKCDICDFSTSAQNGLSLHKRRLHKLDKNNEAVTQLDNPDFHNRDPKKYRHQCLRCTRRYKKIHHLERHQNKCDGIPPPTFKPMWEKGQAHDMFLRIFRVRIYEFFYQILGMYQGMR